MSRNHVPLPPDARLLTVALFFISASLITFLINGCSRGMVSASSPALTITVAAPVAVSITPQSAEIGASGTQQFAATVTGTTNVAVTWSVDGVAGGNAQFGTISATGLYTAPSIAGNHTITATSVADSSK